MDIRNAHLAPHYHDLAHQGHAARMGMWIFLSTEVLLFGGLFTGYSVYRYLFSASFYAASHHLHALLGVLDTAILLTSSLFAVLSLHYLRLGRTRAVILFLMLTMLMGLGFLCVHGYEYWMDAAEGALPGANYHFAALPTPGENLFFTLYFLMTGLHSMHVVIGVGVLAWMTAKVWRGQVDSTYDVPLEVATLYWHLVDVIWIFLFPLLYLV